MAPLGAARFGLLGGVADLGKLELIETLNVSGSSTAEFLNLQESTYDVHFVTFALNLGGGALVAQLSNDGGSSYLSSGYQRAAQYLSLIHI